MSVSLPNGYLKLNWIGSTGTQHIDTGYKPNGKTEIDVSWYWNTDGTTQSRAMFGVDTAWLNKGFSQYCDRLFCYGNGVYRADGTEGGNAAKYMYPSGLHHLVFKNQHLNLNNEIQFDIPEATFQCQYNLWLFAHNRAGSKESTGGMDRIKFYYCKIWERNAANEPILVRDFIPCLRISDNKPGVYDLVNDVFYTNQMPGTDFVFELSVYKTYIDNHENYKSLIATSNTEATADYKTLINR